MSEAVENSQTEKRRRWPKRTGIALAVLAILIGGIVALLPTAATWQIETQLHKLGAKSVRISDISINPATGEISVRDFKSVGPDGEDIVVGTATLRIDLAGLAFRRITVNELTVADADIDIRRDANGLWSIGGFPMAFGGEAPADKSSETHGRLGARSQQHRHR